MAWTRKLVSGKVLACWRDDAGQVHSKALRTERAAKQYANDREGDVRKGVYRDPKLGRERLDDFWERFIDGAEHNLAPSSAHLYRGLYRLHVKDVLGKRSLASITPLDIENLLRGMAARDIGAPTRAGVFRLVRRILSAATRDRLIASNPCSSVKAPRVHSSEMRVLTLDELEALIEETPPQWRAFVMLAGFGGLRIGEIVAFKQQRIQWLKRTARVSETYAEIGGRLVPGPPKGGSARTVSIPSFVVEALSEHVRHFPPKRDGLLFHTGGKPVYPSNFRREVWRPAAKRAGFEGLRFHDLRHTAISLAIQAGAPLKAVQVLAGHKSAALTADRYAHLLPSVADDVASRLDALVRERSEKFAAWALRAEPST